MSRKAKNISNHRKASPGQRRENNTATIAKEPKSEKPQQQPEPLLQEGQSEDPAVTQLAGLRRPISLSAVMLTGLFILALIYTLYFTRSLLLPITLAILLNFVITPMVRWLQYWYIPPVVTAIGVVTLLYGLIGAGIYVVSQPARDFLNEAPTKLSKVETKLSGVVEPIEEAAESAEKLEKATTKGDTPTVQVKGPSLIGVALDYAQSLGAGVAVSAVLLIFFISLDEIFLHKLVKVLPTIHDKKLAVAVAREIERDVSCYLTTVTVINIGLGIVTGTAMWLIGVPTPFLWGVMAGAVNYIPYVGPGAGIVILGIVGLVSFDSLTHATLPALVYFMLNVVEANFVTPLILGKRLDLNPAVILLSIAFWGFLWGVAGMLLAVPLLVTFKTICDHITPLNPIAEFLSGAESNGNGAAQAA